MHRAQNMVFLGGPASRRQVGATAIPDGGREGVAAPEQQGAPAARPTEGGGAGMQPC